MLRTGNTGTGAGTGTGTSGGRAGTTGTRTLRGVASATGTGTSGDTAGTAGTGTTGDAAGTVGTGTTGGAAGVCALAAGAAHFRNLGTHGIASPTNLAPLRAKCIPNNVCLWIGQALPRCPWSKQPGREPQSPPRPRAVVTSISLVSEVSIFCLS